jgi:N-acetylneuraminate lyase
MDKLAGKCDTAPAVRHGALPAPGGGTLQLAKRLPTQAFGHRVALEGEISMEKTIGLVAAPFAPMRADGELDLAVIPAYAEKLRRDGVRGVFVNGTTGEGLSLTSAERKAVTEAWRAHAGSMKLFAHVGHTSVLAAGELATHAERIGVDAIAAIAPCFFKPALPELAAFCAAVAKRAPGTPFYFYHMPSMSGVAVSALSFLRSAAPAIPTLAGVKFTCEDLMDYQQCVAEQGGRFDMLFGRDEILLSALAVGARGAVGSTYNYAAPLYRRIVDAFARGDLAEARRRQARAQALVRILIDSGNGVVCGKAMMPLLSGIDCGPCRLPLPAFGPEKVDWLRGRLDAWRKDGEA